MRIMPARKVPVNLPYSKIAPGECFQVFDKIHIKGNYRTNGINGNVISTDLDTGVCYDYKDDTMVERVAAHVVLE